MSYIGDIIDMIAYLVLVHRYPNQFKRLFKAIYHPDNYYLIHVDKKSGIELQTEIANFLSSFPNASLLESKKTLWGGYSLVDAELRAIKKLLKINKAWDFFINLSGQDFPLKSQQFIHDFLRKNKDKDFLKISDQRKNRPNTLHRIENHVVELNDQVIVEPIVKRSFLKGVTPYIGNQWMILSRKFCEFVTNNPESERFKTFYKNTLIADEGFFQTVIMNTSYKSTIVNDDQRLIDWVPMGTIKLRPRDFISKDASFLMNNKNLFARKFDETVDNHVFDILEKHLSLSTATAMAQ